MVKAYLDQSRLVIWVLSFCGAVTASGQGARAQGASGKSCWVHGMYIPYWCVCAIPYTYWGVAGCGQGVAPGASLTAPCPARPAVAPLPSGAGHAEPGRLPAAAAAFLSWLIADKTGRP